LISSRLYGSPGLDVTFMAAVLESKSALACDEGLGKMGTGDARS
jgi:hypothetical protein